MAMTSPSETAAPDLAEETTELVRRWLADASKVPSDKAAQRLAGLLQDPRGLPFTVGFIDGVIRPEDSRVAARTFAQLARDVPAFLPWHLRVAVRLGAITGVALPGVVIPIVRRVLRSMVGHLIVDATESRLQRSIARIRRGGARLNVNLLGEAVLGQSEASRRLEGTRRLLARDDVDYVSIKVSATVAPHSEWAFDETVQHIAANLTPLFQLAASAVPAKFINLDMEEYRDLDLTMAVFKRLLGDPQFLHLEAGIVLQAYLPDALSAMIELQEWSSQRRAAGGAPIKVRVVKGANLPMERVESSMRDWPLATWPTKKDSDTNYKRVISYALHPDRIENVRIGVAGHNLFDLAFAWLLAGRRGVQDGVEIEMLLGMAQSQAEVVKKEVGGLLLYTPVVHPREFDVAIAYLIRRLEEGASHDNFMSAIFDLHQNAELFERERARFTASLAALDDAVPMPNRQQNRCQPPVEEHTSGFVNTPDTDSSIPANRRWADQIFSRIPTSSLGSDLVAEHTVTDAGHLERILSSASEHGRAWGAVSSAERATTLRRCALALEGRRAEFAEVMASETGKTLEQSDPEISEAVDFARYYAERALDLDRVDGAIFEPSALTVVTPPWNFPVAIPAGSTLAALAAGSAVVIKPAPQAARCGSLMVDALWEAGVPRDVLQLAHIDEGDLGRQLVADPRVDRVILTGSYETAELFRSFRPDLPILAETSGKNAVIVTPSADLDLAAAHVAASAFGHAGQKCSAASLVILVGSVSTSRRFRQQLIDAVTSLKVGYPEDPSTQMGPLVEPASGKLLRALSSLAPGEKWEVEPKQLDDTGRLWSPCVRSGVQRGSDVHLNEFFGPVLGIMTAKDLDEAIDIQNQVAYGLTAGLQSLDSGEIATWLDRVDAGNLYINRGTTGAIVQRQPFGGWKKSSVGPGFKAGGPNYLIGLGSWRTAGSVSPSFPLTDTAERLLSAARASGLEVETTVRAFQADARAWAEHFSVVSDVSQLSAERNLFRYVPTPVLVRLSAGASESHLLRVVGAGLLAGAEVSVSVASRLPSAVEEAFADVGVGVVVEPEPDWLAAAGRIRHSRVRLIGAPAATLAEPTGGRPDLAIYDGEVTESGRIEILPFVKEQAISITAHRFGTPDHLTDSVI